MDGFSYVVSVREGEVELRDEVVKPERENERGEVKEEVIRSVFVEEV